MRLHYLHLPRYGPLRDLEVVFRQETLLPHRQGVINFVVGVNGTGKTSLLRALYEVFAALEQQEVPPFPVTLAYEISREFAAPPLVHCVLLDYQGGARSEARFRVERLMPPSPDAAVGGPGRMANRDLPFWRNEVAQLRKHDPKSAGKKIEFAIQGQNVLSVRLEETVVYGSEFAGNNLLPAHLPRRVLVYTSGDLELWERVAQVVTAAEDLTGLSPAEARGGSRPANWSLRQEREQMVGRSLGALFAESEQAEKPGIEASADLLNRLRDLAGRQRALWLQPSAAGQLAQPRCVLLHPRQVRLAGICLGLWHAAAELRDRRDEASRQALRKELLEAVAKGQPGEGPRRVLNAVDWLWPTHLSLVLNPEAEPKDEGNQARLFALFALAEEVLWQPLGRRRVVLSLGPRPLRWLFEVAAGYMGENLPEAIQEVCACGSAAPTGAEAFLTLFSPKAGLLPLFEALSRWQAMGYLEDVTLTVKRLHPTPEGAGQTREDSVIAYESLSDGEQELLGRMALLFLLRGESGSLLLLDEPETHFNDVWKREIVDLVDDNLLKDTAAQVVVATHSSIALTDVFASEITLLRRGDERTEVMSAPLPTFGEEPGEIMVRLFGASETIGGRAAEWLDELIRQKWTPEQRAELERIISQIGAGYYRSELRAALKKLPHAPPP